MKSDFGSAFLRAEDLIQNGVWSELKLTIKEAHPPNTIKIKDGKDLLDKEALSFVESDQYLVMGTLSWRLMRYATGIEFKEQCIGQVITLYAARGKWFVEKGEPDIAAIRIRIPKEGVRPNVKKNIMGTDITGQRFRKPVSEQAPTPPLKRGNPPGTPVRPADEQIYDCKSGVELLSLLKRWTEARPVHAAPEKWLIIVADAWRHIDNSKFEDVNELEPYVQEISDEAHLTLEEKKQGKVTQ